MSGSSISTPYAMLVTDQVKPGGKFSHVESLCAGLELIGWREPKIVFRFMIVAIIFALLSLSTLKLR